MLFDVICTVWLKAHYIAVISTLNSMKSPRSPHCCLQIPLKRGAFPHHVPSPWRGFGRPRCTMEWNAPWPGDFTVQPRLARYLEHLGLGMSTSKIIRIYMDLPRFMIIPNSPNIFKDKISMISGWWLSHQPLWKMMEWKSVGMMTFPIYGKIKHVPNHQPD